VRLRWFALSLVLILLSAAGASAVQTQFGRVSVNEYLLPMPNGEELSVLVHKPDTATAASPAPAVVTTHGYFNSKGMQDAAAVELSRRGVVVFSFDLYHHGRSSGTRETYLKNREFSALGMLDLVEYVSKEIDYVDSKKIGITGHSTGGRSVSYALDAYGRNARAAQGGNQTEYAAQPANANDYKTAVRSALIVANVPAPYLIESIPPGVDVGILMGRYDEGAPMQLTKMDGYLWADLTVSPEIKNFINLAQPGTFKLDRAVTPTETGKPTVKFSGWNNEQKVELGKFYGEPGSGAARVVYNPSQIHPWNHFSSTATADVVQFFTETLDVSADLAAGNQVWWVKETLNAIGLVGFFIFALQVVRLLLMHPAFASLYRSVPEKEPLSRRGKGWFYGSLAATAAFAGLSVMPLMQLNTALFPETTMQNTNSWFDQPSTNQILIWALGNALFGLLLLAAARRWGGVKTSLRGALRESPRNLIKIIVLVILALFVVYGVVALIWGLFRSDFRFWTLAVQAPTTAQVISALKYVLPFLAFYLVSAIATNITGRHQQARWKNLLSICAGTVGGLIVVILVQYSVLFTRGEALWHLNLSWINVLLLIPLIPYLSVTIYYARTIYEETGSVVLPAVLNASLLTLMTTANTTTISTLS
jgi:dienelactone hydrolase